ncbi:MAG TPA: hypothetical protein DHW14_06835 [Clostridiales bacterium]|nr:hypothetical protein [Clostridiales bacterium]
MAPSDAETTRPDHSYTIRLTFFLNAKHRVPTGHGLGPAHNHSWRLEAEFQSFFPQAEDVPAVGFAELERAVRDVLRPYEGRYLNELPPFDKVPPATENIARFLFGAIGEATAALGVRVLEVTLWETPTKGTTVRTSLPEAGLAAWREAAAARGPEVRRRPPQAMPRAPDSDQSRPGQSGARRACVLAPLLAAALIAALVTAAYWPLITARPPEIFPWGSDTWGHLFKAYYLFSHAAASDDLSPNLMPWWYAGIEPFRYWAPLPYYLLAVVRYVSGSIFTAGNWLIPLCAVLGGLSWLAFARRLGWLGAGLAGLCWAVWPDHIRVALAEGNLPRVVATALLPLLFAAFLGSLERRKWPWSGLAFVLFLNLLVLSHAMMAAIACVVLAVFSLFYWWFGGIRGADVARGLALTALALLCSAWWLVPSLSGGITAIDPEAARQAIHLVPPAVSFNPLLRLQNPESFYLGASSLCLLGLALLGWRRRDPSARASFVVGLLLIVLTFPVARPLVAVLPGMNLLWPLRFASLLPVLLFLAAMPRPLLSPPPPAGAGPGKKRVSTDSPAPGRTRPDRGHTVPVAASLTVVLAAALVLGDSWGSLHLIHTRRPNPELAAVADALEGEQGWRVAVLDLSRLGSEPSFVLSHFGGREQVFGWAWQGAAIGRELVLLNTALEQGRYTYVVDRSLQLGATDLLVPRDSVDRTVFEAVAEASGYTDRESFGPLDLYRRGGPPFALRHSYGVLAIGRHAGTVSLLFPAVEAGPSGAIDSYEPSELARYHTVFLTGALWRSRDRAEDVIRAYIRGGGRVVVDLTGFPSGTLSKRPSFLGVAGEPVRLSATPDLSGPWGTLELEPMTGVHDPWVAVVPQELDRVLLSFDHFGQTAVVLGEKDLEEGTVTFIGLNLLYHTFLTDDPAAAGLLAELLGVESGRPPARETTPLQAYQAGPEGYRFIVSVPREWGAGPVILPFAFHDAVSVSVDGEAAHIRAVEHLMAVHLTPGNHHVVVEHVASPLAGVSTVTSALAMTLLGAYVFLAASRAPAGRRRKEAVSPDAFQD